MHNAPIMKRPIRKVAVLLRTNSDWGRNAIEGIMDYEHEAGPWYLRLHPAETMATEEIPEAWFQSDGIIAAVYSPDLARRLKETRLPTLNVADTSIPGFSAPNLRTDDAIGTRMAVDHFTERGFRHLAFAGPKTIANAREYNEHFQNAVANAGLQHAPTFPFDGSDTETLAPLTEWLHALPKPVGILAWGHGYAQAIVDACMLAEIPVPHDVAILSGSNDNFLCNACYPPLSGVRTPMRQIGYHAAKLLDRMMRGEKVPHEISYFPPTGIVERLSTETLAVKDVQLRKVIAFMREHAYEAITVEDVLTAVPMARSSLEQRFQKKFGRTPAEEIRRLRINKARELLAGTDMSMQQIAEACGYSSYNYLSFAFKKVTGMPPRSYRKSARI